MTPAALLQLAPWQADALGLWRVHERAVIFEGDGWPPDWAVGFAALCDTRHADGGAALDRALRLVDDHGGTLHAAGWCFADLFAGLAGGTPCELADAVEAGAVLVTVRPDLVAARFPDGRVVEVRKDAGAGSAAA